MDDAVHGEHRGGPPSDAEGELATTSSHGADRALMAAHSAGDPLAFSLVFFQHRSALYDVALRILRNHHDAEDALSDALLKAIRSSHTYRGESAVLTWMRAIVYNTSLDLMVVRRRQWLEGRADPVAAVEHRRPSHQPASDLSSQSHELQMEDALAQLPREYRRSFFLVAILGFTLIEVAELEGVAVGTVKSRVWRARTRLAEYVMTGNL